MTLSHLKVILYCKPSDVIFARVTLWLHDICCHRMCVCLFVCYKPDMY